MTDNLESRFTAARAECPHPNRWTSPDGQGTEYEVIEGICGLIRLLQPDYCIETGTYHGHMASAIGQTLHHNGQGHLDTFEIDPDRHAKSLEATTDLPVTCHLLDPLDFEPENPIDFIWIDSGDISQRMSEFYHFLPHLKRHAVVAFHDSGLHHWDIYERTNALRTQGKLSILYLPTPRGVALAQVHK